MKRSAVIVVASLLAGCAPPRAPLDLPNFTQHGSFGERTRVLDLYPGVTATVVAPTRQNPENTLVVLVYDDRNIMLDGKKVVSDSGGTWRASSRMMNYLREPFEFKADKLGAFVRYRAPIAPDLTLPPASPPDIPPREANAMTGTAFIASLARLSREERERAIRRELLAGNMPSFMRKLRTVEASFVGSDSIKHTIAYEVMPDYLAIGSDDDFVRMPMIPYTAQDFCDAFGFVLPTRKMVNDIWRAATTHLDPRPMTEARESPLTFLQHHRVIEEQLERVERGTFVAGIKKDVVVTTKLSEHPQRVAIYGWHYPTGAPIQPLYTGHADWYVDYSHGVRPVRRWMRMDGRPVTFEKILSDVVLSGLLSDEGEVSVSRYDK